MHTLQDSSRSAMRRAERLLAPRPRIGAAIRSAALLCGVAFAVSGCRDAGGGTGDTEGSSTVELVGERAGLMVWRPVSGASSYRLEILGVDGAPEWTFNTADTVGPLPPGYQSDAAKKWWVRAYDTRRQIGASTKARMY